MGRKDEAFVKALLAGLTWRDAARESGLSEARARAFLTSIARFAGSMVDPADFAAPVIRDEPGGRKAPEPPFRDESHESLLLYTDGASNGNPGPAGAGGVIMTADGRVLEEFHAHLGRATNNVAEYEAVRIALTKALALGAKSVAVRLDSELVANQLSGRFRVKDKKLVDMYLKVSELMSRLESVTFEAIPRERNTRADMLAQVGAKSGG